MYEDMYRNTAGTETCTQIIAIWYQSYQQHVYIHVHVHVYFHVITAHCY